MAAEHRAVATVWGDTKSGKSRFGFTAPAPIYYFDFNFGSEGVIEPYESKIVQHYLYPLPPFPDLQEQAAVLDQFVADYRGAIKKIAAPGTLFVDTATELDDLLQMRTLEEVRVHKYNSKTDAEDFQPVPFDYGRRNALMHSVISAPLTKPGVNALFVNLAKEEYSGKGALSAPTGRLIMGGWKRSATDAQVTVETLRTGSQFSAQLSCCRVNTRMEGVVLDVVDWDTLLAVMWAGK